MRELYKVYVPGMKQVPQSDIDDLVARLNDKTISFEDAETEVKLQGLTSVKPPCILIIISLSLL